LNSHQCAQRTILFNCVYTFLRSLRQLRGCIFHHSVQRDQDAWQLRLFVPTRHPSSRQPTSHIVLYMRKMVLFYVTSMSACGRRDATRTGDDTRLPLVVVISFGNALLNGPPVSINLPSGSGAVPFLLVQVFIFPRYTMRIPSHLISSLDVFSS
jgi:hypothetical protein